MRHIFVSAVLAMLCCTAALADSGDGFDWKQWRHLPVQDSGRRKPLDTLAWETLRMLCNRASIEDSATGQKLDAVGWYLSMVLDYQPPAPSADPHGFGMTRYVYNPSDKWDSAPLLRVDYLPLRKAIGMADDQKYLSPYQLNQSKIEDPKTGKAAPFVPWAQKLLRKQERTLSAFERKGLELAGNLWSYEEHRAGKRLGLLPIQGNADELWASAYDFHQPKPQAAAPTAAATQVKEQWDRVRAAYRAGSASEFNEASAGLLATLEEVGPQQGPYPEARIIDLEVAYNHYPPFRVAWGFTLLAFLLVLVSMGTGWRSLYAASLAAFGLGLVAMTVGFTMRTIISSRAPVTNMYESVVWVGMGAAMLGLIFELIYRKRYILAAASAVATIALILADNCPAVLDPSLKPLQPVLRSNFWLATHVLTITLSYAAFALALGIGNITLGYFLVRSKNQALISSLTNFTYRSLQVGVVLLAAGTILGGVWADYSWGRFWGWDPKEVWALIALLGYLAVLHARYVGWLKDLGLAIAAVGCFSLVVMAWYGVNYWLGTGLHSYGFGGGGQQYVSAVLLAQFAYVVIAVLRASQPEVIDATVLESST